VELNQAYQADGCGKSASYEGDCGILFCSVYTSESRKQERAAMGQSFGAQPSQPSRSTLASAPAGPEMVSFTLHNNCPHEVLLFYGDHPQRGGGTQSSIGANTSESKFMRAGQSIWIIDKDRKPVSVFTVDITESCSGFVPR
jgi:hypothetical protein